MPKINFTTPIVLEKDSSLKKLFKEFFNFSGVRYTQITPQNGNGPIEVEKSEKTGVLKTNIFKVALCFTLFVPIIAAISKFIELHNLKTKTFTVIDSKRSSDPTSTKVQLVQASLLPSENPGPDITRKEPVLTASPKKSDAPLKNEFETLKNTKSISSFTFEEICKYSEKMRGDDWKQVTDEQFQNFDFDKINKTVLANMAYGLFYEKKDRLNTLTSEQIYLLAPIFTEYLRLGYWSSISIEQIRLLDFNKISFSYSRNSPYSLPNEKTVRQLAVRQLLNLKNPDDGVDLSRIAVLTSNQIYSLSKSLSLEHWGALSKEQILALDFKKVRLTDEIVKTLFIKQNEPDLIPELTPNQIYALAPYFNKHHWERISDEQLPLLDFKNVSLNFTITHALFDLRANREGVIWPNTAPKNRMVLLNSKQIYDLSSCLSEEHWDGFYASQILELDFSKMNLEKKIVQILFSIEFDRALNRVPKLTSNQILQLAPYFDITQWQYLSDKQATTLDYNELKIEPLTFDILFSNDHLNRISSLSWPQMGALASHFQPLHSFQISTDQLNAFDLEALKLTGNKKESLNLIFPEDLRKTQLANLPQDQRALVENILNDENS